MRAENPFRLHVWRLCLALIFFFNHYVYHHGIQDTPSRVSLEILLVSTSSFTMVRHKKDNFSRGGKKFNNPRPRVPRGDEEVESATSSRPPYKAACWDMGHCDPKRCSGKRLMRLGLMRELHIGQRHSGVIVSYVSQSRNAVLVILACMLTID